MTNDISTAPTLPPPDSQNAEQQAVRTAGAEALAVAFAILDEAQAIGADAKDLAIGELMAAWTAYRSAPCSSQAERAAAIRLAGASAALVATTKWSRS